MTGPAATSRMPQDPVKTLREYRGLAPWNVRDLSTLACALLDATGIRPASSVAADHPTPRTIRYYVAKGVLTNPTGRGPTATYGYQHLLEVLAIKLRQVDGQPLKSIGTQIPRDAEALEREVTTAVGTSLPPPNLLHVAGLDGVRGKAARAFHTWHALGGDDDPDADLDRRLSLTKWHRIPIVRGLELHIHEGHPLADLANKTELLGDAVRRALGSVLRTERDGSGTPEQ